MAACNLPICEGWTDHEENSSRCGGEIDIRFSETMPSSREQLVSGSLKRGGLFGSGEF